MIAVPKWIIIALAGLTCELSAKPCHHYRLNGSVEPQQLWQDISYLSSDALQGRKTQTPGAALTRQYLVRRYQQIGLSGLPTTRSFELPFTLVKAFTDVTGVNVAGMISGQATPQRYIVVTAHYDHLGTSGRRIYNGADDNASGVAALLAIAQAMRVSGTQSSIVFVVTDAEESGLYGAKGFMQTSPIELSSIKANLNLDMLAQNRGRNRLYISASGGRRQFTPLVQQAIGQAGLCLVSGHRSATHRASRSKPINWRKASDHAVFAKAGIPYLYIGVSDHIYYHSERDTVDRIDPRFFTAAVETSLQVLTLLDQHVSGKQ